MWTTSLPAGNAIRVGAPKGTPLERVSLIAGAADRQEVHTMGSSL